MVKKVKVIKEFESMLDMSKLKALSNISIQRPLTEKEYEEAMRLKRRVLQ